MKIEISILDLEPTIRELYLNGKIKSLGIDYQPNALMGWVDGKEIEVFNFSKVCKMDNRWTGYELHQSTFEITIQITGLNK
jgi:hypothetical protein